MIKRHRWKIVLGTLAATWAMFLLSLAVARAQAPLSIQFIGINVGGGGGDTLVELPDGSTLLNPGSTAANQLMIPRFRAGSAYPSGMLLGWGPQSVIVGNASTASQAFPAVVFTQDAGVANISQWQGGTSGHPEFAPAILGAEVRDCSIWGYDPTATNYAAEGDVATNPDNNAGKPFKYYLLYVRGNGCTVQNVKLFYAPGTAFVFGRDLNDLNGQLLPFDSEKNYADKIRIARCYSGLDVASVDLTINDVEVTKWRDFAIKMFSATQASKLHCYGGGGAGIWATSTANQIELAYSENTPTGFYMQGSQNLLHNIRSHTCSTRNVLLEGNNNVVDGFTISGGIGSFPNPNPLCFEVWGEECIIKNGSCELRSGDTGVKITNGTRHTIRDVYFKSHNVFDTTCVNLDATLNDSEIEFLMIGGGTGLDVNDNGTSRLGVLNKINIRAALFGSTTEVIDLPDTWNRSNKIEVDGMLLKGTVTASTIGSPTTITAPSHGLATGDQVAIGGMLGTNSCNSGAGQYYTVTVVNANQFTIGNHTGTHTAGTGWWGTWQSR